MTTVIQSNYEVLGVSTTATQEEIRIAYKRLAMKFHPDKGGSIEEFQRIKKAYEALKNRVCPVCEGRGQIRERRGAFTKLVNCPKCWENK